MFLDNQELNLHQWLMNWIETASEQEVRGKFKEVLPYLDEQDIAYLCYHFILREFPQKQEEIDSLLQ
jgi:hypothetical protein